MSTIKKGAKNQGHSQHTVYLLSSKRGSNPSSRIPISIPASIYDHRNSRSGAPFPENQGKLTSFQPYFHILLADNWRGGIFLYPSIVVHVPLDFF